MPTRSPTRASPETTARRAARSVLLLLVASATAGCATTVARPASWPATRGGGFFDSAVETVSFENAGRAVYSGGREGPALLASRLFRGLTPTEAFAVSHVTVEARADGGARVAAWVGPELLVEQRLDDATSQDAGRSLALSYLTGSSWVGTTGVRPIRMRLERTTDGGVVIEEEGTDMGIFVWLLLPVWRETDSWAYFRPGPGARGGTPPEGVDVPAGPRLRLRVPDHADGGPHDHASWREALNAARRAGTRPLSAEERAALGGRPTRRFVEQHGEDSYWPCGQSGVWLRFDGLETHDGRIEKAHDLPDVVVDRFIASLVLRGYVWEND